ncbi:MAG: quinol:cytochrome C oxidoreductase, partial [Eudoraea sp.]
MYTFSNRLKITSFILMAVGVLGIGIGFVSAPDTVEEAKAMVAVHDDGYGDSHGEDASQAMASDHGEASDHSGAHDEHLLHQLQNRPWSALYVAAFFFFMIALGVLAFYGIQRASQAGWSPMLFRVMEGITAYI